MELKAEAPASRYRSLSLFWRWVVIIFSAIGIFIAIYQVFHLQWFNIVIQEISYYHLMMAFFLPIVFIVFLPKREATSKKLFYLDIFLFLLTAGLLFFTASKGSEIRFEGWGMMAPPYMMAVCLLVWALMMEAARRAAGTVLMVVVLLFSVYPLLAGHMPGVLYGIQSTLDRVAVFHLLSTESVIGIPMRVFSNLIIGFIVFGAALQITGGGRFFINLALSLLGKTRGGTAKVSVLASAFFGSMSGSVISNVLTTGSFTIPAMKRGGYPPHYAGAIEACASTGGVLMPPVMGATAFIMASFLGVPYLTVVIAAVVPSVLYYLGLLIQVDGYATQQGLRGWDPSEIPSLLKTFKNGWFYIVAFAVLLLFLFLRREAQAPFIATGVMLLLATFDKETRLTPTKLADFFETSGRLLSELVAILAAVGMILGALALTGVAHSLAGQLVQLAGGNLALLLLFGAITSFILGMGMTITACYVFLAIILVPALIGAGLNPLAVHLFVMYCGMFSYITPPVALGAFAGATLAGASQMRTGLTATRIGGIIYVLPFLFVLNPALILQGSAGENLLAIALAIPGIILIASALQGYLVGIGSLSIRKGFAAGYLNILRVALFGAGILMIYPSVMTDLIGVGVGVAVILLLILRKVVTKTGDV